MITILLLFIFSAIAAIFWYQESRYLLPTPVPEIYKPISVGQTISTDKITSENTWSKKPTLLHFFNPDCPCSRFNIAHFIRLVSKYSRQYNFIAVLQTEEENGAKEHFEDKYGLHIPVIVDIDKKLAVACGVYATPQAVILDNTLKLYYRGNYNKSRYCTTKDSNFAQMAMDSLLAGNKPPVFIELATQAYGCALPDSSYKENTFNIFN